MSDRGNATPYWAAHRPPPFRPLDRDLAVDVAIVGAGITGLTAAYLLAHAGRRVAVLERGRLGSGDTGHTTAHLTAVTDLRPAELARQVGSRDAAGLWSAGAAAIDTIERIASTEGIDCQFRRVPGYLHLPIGLEARRVDDERGRLEQDAAALRQWDGSATLVERVPVMETPGLRLDQQALFHPGAYLNGLAQRLVTLGVSIHEESAPTFTDDAEHLECLGYTVRAPWVVIATHSPIAGRQNTVAAELLQTRLFRYTSYALHAVVRGSALPEGLYWDTSEPYRYVRIEPAPEGSRIITGGEDHRTGQGEDTRIPQATLEHWTRRIFPDADLTHRWSGQVMETPDLLPLIGEAGPRQWLATGFAGNGMTFGTLAGIMLRDALDGIPHPLAELLSPSRSVARREPWEYVRGNASFPYYMLERVAGHHDVDHVDQITKGTGAVVQSDGQAVAAYRDQDGALHRCSAVCTHMGCLVHWNQVERTWDCPCHGSRYSPTGEVISGPAVHPLRPVATAASTEPHRSSGG
jgi:glycine/D-amino acid oxidase-like deaminating enzyme/nitrite reductase/ring-hydroxylating ferredoxin subunit